MKPYFSNTIQLPDSSNPSTGFLVNRNLDPDVGDQKLKNVRMKNI